jgi:hypothetical protein
MNRIKLLVYVLAVTGLLALGAAPSYAVIDQIATAGYGGPQFLSTSLPRQARGNGITETVGEVVLGVTNPAGAAILDGSSIDLLYAADITNEPDAIGVNVLCNGGGCPDSMELDLVGDNILRIRFFDEDLDATTGTVFDTLGDTITIAGVRVDASAISSDGAQVTVTLSGVSAAPATNPITFTDPFRTVATLVNPELDIKFNDFNDEEVVNIATCNPGDPDVISTTVEENYPAALTTEAQEETFSDTPDPDNGTTVMVIISGVPEGVPVTPTSDTFTNGDLLVLEDQDGGDSVESDGGAITFTFDVTSSDTSDVEDVEIFFNLTDIEGLFIGSPQTISIAVQLGPSEEDDDEVIVRFVENTQDEDDVAVISDCVTRLMWPWVLAGGTTGYDTGIAIANTTSDDVAFADNDDDNDGNNGAIAQAGTCQLTGYKSSDGTTVAATRASVAAGRTDAFLASGLTGWSGFSGYVLGVCNFTNAHAFTFIANGFGTLAGPTLAEGYVALVVPAGSREVVADELTEELHN